MKRFTETAKWRDPWFRRLSGSSKLLWLYLLDHCDSIGLVELDLGFASEDCGQPIKEKHLTELGDRVEVLNGGKVFIPKFISFQYGTLSPACPPHKSIISATERHGLIRVGVTYHYPSVRDKTRQEEDKTRQDKIVGGMQGGANLEAVEVLHWLNEKSGRSFRETDENLGFISARLAEPGVDLDGVKKMVVRQCARWLGTEQAEYLRPQTLFNATKFDGYYAARDQAVPGKNGKPESHQLQEVIEIPLI